MKINRLFEIIYILLDKEKVTAKELAERFEVSTRTIYRDLEDLSAGGVPIYMSKGKNGGIALLSDFVLNKTTLTAKEKSSILSALQSLNTFDHDSIESVLSKLSSFFGENSTGYYEIDYSGWDDLIKDQFDKAKQSIANKKILSFEYVSSHNSMSKRIVEPYKLWFKGNNWYLKAFCLEKNALRIFRFSRMRNVEIQDKAFIPRNVSFELTNEDFSESTVEIVMRIEADATYRLLDEFHEKNILQNQDGSFTVKMNFVEDDWVYGYILSFGAFATVIRPKRIREIIKDKLEHSLANYSSDEFHNK